MWEPVNLNLLMATLTLQIEQYHFHLSLKLGLDAQRLERLAIANTSSLSPTQQPLLAHADMHAPLIQAPHILKEPCSFKMAARMRLRAADSGHYTQVKHCGDEGHGSEFCSLDHDGQPWLHFSPSPRPKSNLSLACFKVGARGARGFQVCYPHSTSTDPRPQPI